MLPDRVSNPGPLTYESGALPIALHGPAEVEESLLELLHRMKRLRVWIKNCIFHDCFSFILPQNEPEVNIIIF